MLDTIKRFLAIEPLHQRDIAIATPFDEFPPLATQIANIRTHTVTHPRVSIAEAIGVPAIQRAVTLISHTVGSLTMEGWRNGAPMPETPIVLARPDPYQTAVDWYSSVGWGMAVYGEAIGYVARRDGAGFPIALIDVPPVEPATVEPNPRNRLRAIYKWGTITGTRYSTADPTGDFVHITYHRDSTSLRGVGPLQMCGVAVSVAVEAQNWAAGFFAGGGVPPLIIKSAVELDGSTDDTGLSEAQKLKAAWMAGDNNVPKVIDPGIDEVQQLDFNPQGAQLLDARQANNGDAARMFGIPGTLLEYNMPGSSLTYQNVADVWVQFLRGCLQPSYLEKIEAHMSDLLPRSQAARFNTKNLLRADIKTRYDVYTAGIAAGVISVEQAQAEEGFIPGDIERMPVAPSPPAAVPSDIANSETLQSRALPVRCDGRRVIRGVLARCNTLLAEHGPFVGTCRKCKKEYVAQPSEALVVRSIGEVQVIAPEPPPFLERALVELLSRPQPEPPVVHVHNAPAEVTVHPATVNVTTPEVTVQPHFDFAPAVTNVTVPPPEAINVTVGRQPTRKRIERDGTGLISFVVEE